LQRGRKSGAALSIISPIQGITRLAPPAELPEAQRSTWLALVNSRPAEWFGAEHEPLLRQYCRHKANADVIAQQIELLDQEALEDDEGLKRYERLCALMVKETNAMHSLARGMRLTQQSTYDESRAKTLENAAKGRKPWQRRTIEGSAEHSVDRGTPNDPRGEVRRAAG
jgi:hypothetical protein